MKEYYYLNPLKGGEYKYIGFSLTCDRLDSYYCVLEKELKRLRVKGKVLLDLISSNGIKSQRYVSLYFNGRHFDFDTFENITNVDSAIEKMCLKFYASHYEAIENSVLTKPQRFLFKKKLHESIHA